MKILIDTPYFNIRPKNTDWRYTRYILPKMSEHIPVDFFICKDFERVIRESYDLIKQNFQRRISNENLIVDNYIRKELSNKFEDIIEKMKPDLIYTHSSVPFQTNGIPVIWHHAVVDPIMLSNRISGSQQRILNSAHYNTLNSVKSVLLNSDVQLKRHKDTFPDFSQKYESAPFFLPGISGMDEVLIKEKHSNLSNLNILFVGREAKRKGLDLVLDALSQLYKKGFKNFNITVVSSLADGNINLNREYPLRHYNELDYIEVKKLMAISHVFAMPSRVESYGFTYIEAMANGCIVLGSNWEIQNELIGDVGISLSPKEDEVMINLQKLFELDFYERYKMAQKSVAKFKEKYAPEIVAKNHFDIFDKIVN